MKRADFVVWFDDGLFAVVRPRGAAGCLALPSLGETATAVNDETLACRSRRRRRSTGAIALSNGQHERDIVATVAEDLTDSECARIEEDALRVAEVLCREPSVSAEGRALESTAQLVQELLDDVGFETRQLRVEDAPLAVLW